MRSTRPSPRPRTSALLIVCNPAIRRPGLWPGRAGESQRSRGEVWWQGVLRRDSCSADLPGSKHLPYASISGTTASHTITALSASKAWNLAGLKCAQLILSNDADAGHWNEVGQFIGHGASIVGIIANCVAYAEGKPWLDEVIAYLDGNRKLGDLLAEHLPEVRYIQPEGTYLAWLDFRSYTLPEDLGTFFREEAKVAVVDGPACGEAGRVPASTSQCPAKPCTARSARWPAL